MVTKNNEMLLTILNINSCIRQFQTFLVIVSMQALSSATLTYKMFASQINILVCYAVLLIVSELWVILHTV